MSIARLFYSSPEIDADLLYVGRFRAPDPFLAIDAGDGTRIAVVSALEYGRARATSSFNEISDLETLTKSIRQQTGRDEIGIGDHVRFLMDRFEISDLVVSPCFPVGIFQQLKEQGLSVQVSKEPFVPERLRKSREEIEAIRDANRISATGIRRAEEILRESQIAHDHLVYRGVTLTSEILQQEIAIACLRAGGQANHTIAASGLQACDPHEIGQGPIRPNELIIVDVFPRASQSGYFGDMTRTFLKGTPTDAQTHLVETVLAVQQEALRNLRAGTNGRIARETCLKAFEDAGYPTRKTEDGNEGFFHGLGHGLGLEIHEAPSMGRKDEILNDSAVVTVEPGLYFPGIGGCRIEDVVAIHGDNAEMISDYPYDWRLE